MLVLCHGFFLFITWCTCFLALLFISVGLLSTNAIHMGLISDITCYGFRACSLKDVGICEACLIVKLCRYIAAVQSKRAFWLARDVVELYCSIAAVPQVGYTARVRGRASVDAEGHDRIRHGRRRQTPQGNSRAREKAVL